MALSAHPKPHFTTIADFISNQDEEAIAMFQEVILICDEMGLIGREMVAVDGCKLRSKCLRKPDKTLQRQVAYFHVGRKIPETATEKMKQKIDSPSGRQIYSKRFGTVEPVFGHIRHTMKLNWFSMRGKIKVNCQWLLFCTLHNLKKIHRYGSVQVT